MRRRSILYLKDRSSIFSIDEQDYKFVREYLLLNGTPENEIESNVICYVHIRSNDDERRVCTLFLTEANTKGKQKIPASIGDLKMVEQLEVKGDSELPEEIGNLNNLVKLSLRDCSSSPPSSIWLLKNLKELQFSRYYSQLPEEIGNLISLEKISFVDGSKLQFLPKSIGQLKNLKILEIQENRETMELPEEIGNLTSLVKLCLYRTDVKVLPLTIGQLKNLQELDLGKSTIRTLPPCIGRLENLREIDLDNARNLSKLPDEIGNLTSLTKLNLSHTCSLLALPTTIGRLRNLPELDLRYSGVKELPRGIGDMTSLKFLILTKCPMESLPPSIGKLKNLRHLDLMRMEALSKLPDEIGDTTLLQSLYISHTSALKVLPPSIGKLKDLRVIIAEELNAFPKVICKLTCLKCLNLASSQLKSLPRSIGHLKNLEILNLKYSGVEELPEEIGNLTSLKVLKLHFCRLLKKLPRTIGHLKNLQNLDVRGSGVDELPDEIGNLTSLIHLDIGFSFDFRGSPYSSPGIPLYELESESEDEFTIPYISRKLRYRLACLSARSELPILRTAPKLTHLALSRARHAFRISRVLRDCRDEDYECWHSGGRMKEADAIYTFIKTNSGEFGRAAIEARASQQS